MRVRAPGTRALRRSAVAALTLLSVLAPSPARSEPPEERRPTIRFGVISEQVNETDRMLRMHSEFLAELRSRLAPRGIGVGPLVIATDLADLARRIARKEVDLVIETVFVTLDLQAANRTSIAPALAVIRRNQREYHSVFFTSRGSPIRRLRDLRGRTLVLQAERSTTAFAVPRAELARAGIRLVPAGQPAPPTDSVFYAFAGAELNQAVWVLKGRGDAGAFNEGDWAGLPRKLQDGLVIFHETKPLLRGIASFRSGLDETTRIACEDALLDLHKRPSGAAALAKAAGVTRFERMTPWDLAGLNEWRQALRAR